MATVKYLDENGLSTVWSKVKGIVTPKADKVSGATAGHLAGLNSSGNLTDSGLAASNIAQKDGSYSGMTVGAAEDLVSAESVASEFTSRITGGSTAVGKGGTALVDKIKGRTLVWNQLNNFISYTDGTFNNVTRTLTGTSNKVLTVTVGSGGPTAGNHINLVSGTLVFTPGHIYLFSVDTDFTMSAATLRYGPSNQAWFTENRKIWQWPSNAPAAGAFAVRYETTAAAGTYTLRNIMLIDLTKMFGAGNEPSTAAEFEALYPGPYYAYTPGTLINNGKQTEYDLVWNQMCQGVSGVTLSYNSTTNTYYASGTRTYGEGGSETSAFVAGHIYCGKLVVKKDTGSKLKYVVAQAGGGSSNGLTFSVMNGTGTYTAYGTSPNAGNLRVLATFGSSSVTFDVEFSLNVFDLTVMFGAGNEPASPEEFEAMFPNDYYAYDTGTEQHFSFPQFKTAIETVGFNQWDEEWEVGSINENGVPATSSGIVRSKNFCHMMPNTVYKGIADGRSDYLVVYFYDGNYNLIPYSGVDAYANGYNGITTFTSPAGTAYFKFRTSPVYGATYKNDICFNLSDPSRNGTYEPYWRSELELGLGDIKVKSHNIWDEEWENGEYDTTTGAKTGSTYVRTKHYIPVETSTSYYFYKGNNFSNIRVFEYDANQAYIQNTYKNNTSWFILTTASNTKYVTFYTWTDTSYANNICINISDPAYNGRYEPYGDGGVITLTGGLKSAGTVYDEISGGKLVKRIDSINLGSLTYSYDSSINTFAAAHGLSSIAKHNAVAICTKYAQVSSIVSSTPDKVFFFMSSWSGYNYIHVKDTSYTDAATFKASMAGVLLYYELATPIEYELAEAIPTAMRNDPYGTERRLPEDTAAIVTAPFRADITYSTNIKEAVQSLPQNYINVNSMQDFLTALGEQMGGTWTMRPADGKFDFSFTPNPVEPTL